jgi:hypothetical protein
MPPIYNRHRDTLLLTRDEARRQVNPQPSGSQQNLPGWAANALIVAAGICLITSIGLAIADRVAAGTLTAGLFVVCVLFLYLPHMKSFKAFGIAVEWLKEAHRARVELEKSGKELKAEIAKAEIATCAERDASYVEKVRQGAHSNVDRKQCTFRDVIGTRSDYQAAGL